MSHEYIPRQFWTNHICLIITIIIISIIVIIVWQWGPAERCEVSLLARAILTKVWPAHNFTRHYHYRRWSSLSSLDPVAAFAFWKSFSFQSPSFTAQYKVSLSLNCTCYKVLRVHSGYTEIIKLRLRPFQVGLLLVCGEQLVSRFYEPFLERAVLCRCVLPNITVSCKRRDKKYKSVQERQLRRWLYEEKVVIVSGGQIRFAFICANNTNVNEGWFLAVRNSSRDIWF